MNCKTFQLAEEYKSSSYRGLKRQNWRHQLIFSRNVTLAFVSYGCFLPINTAIPSPLWT